jgi:hypothetical protein
MDILSLILKNTKNIEKLDRKICCVQNGCPAISASPGNVITCNSDGLFSTGGGSSIGADNGLTISSNNVQLGSNSYPGSPLLHQTYINSDIYGVQINRSVVGLTFPVFWVHDEGGLGQSLILAESVNNTAIIASSTNSTGVGISSVNGLGAQISSANSKAILATINPGTTNSIDSNTTFIRYTTGTAANGIGMSLDMQLQTTNGTSNPSNSLISKWTTANHATRVSQFIITGVDNATQADLLTLSGNGSLKLNKYGSGTFIGTPTYTLQVDSLGNIIEGGVVNSANSGLSVSAGNTVLGQNVGQLGDPAALLSNREIPMGAFTISHKDSSGNSNVFGAGTFTSTRVGNGINITTNNTVTTNVSAFSIFPTNTTTFGAFSTCSAFNTPVFATKRFNTVSSGQTITTSASNRQSVFFAQLQFENDVAATINPITQSGSNPISVYSSKIDFWPVAGSQHKTITGALCHYTSYLDTTSAISASIGSYMDFEAGSVGGNASFPTAITNRYGFKVRDLNNSGFTITNRWAFYQEGTTDSNYFAGFSGFGTPTPTARIHASAGTATAGTAPLKLTAGTNLTTPEAGAFEFDGTNLYFTVGSTRKTVTLI